MLSGRALLLVRSGVCDSLGGDEDDDVVNFWIAARAVGR